MSKYDMDKISSSAGRTIPDNWIFEHFSKRANSPITAPLDGRNIRMRSFWTNDSSPSLYFFVKNGKYLFKDFSSGKGGNAFTFAHELISSKTHGSWSTSDTQKLIIDEWEGYIKRGGKWSIEIRPRSYMDGAESPKLKVKESIWTETHKKYWEEYKIGENILSRYGVRPLSSFTLEYPNSRIVAINPALAFMFLNSKGVVQIYQPFSSPKYLTFQGDYYLGTEQLGNTKLALIICSGLKDIMAMASLDIDVDLVAGKSESQLIDEDTMIDYLSRYEYVLAAGDYDKTGIRMMKLYEKLYAVKPLLLPLEKDIAENKKRHDEQYIRTRYIELINKKINK